MVVSYEDNLGERTEYTRLVEREKTTWQKKEKIIRDWIENNRGQV